MDKLQDLIDRVFGDVEHKPEQQPLGDAALQREHAFAEGSRKLGALRVARMAKAGSMPSVARGAERKPPQWKDQSECTDENRNMDTPDAGNLAAPFLPVLEYEVVRHRGHWRVLHIGKYSVPYNNQDDAIAAAVARAKQSVAQGRMALVRLIRTDGKERLIDLVRPNGHK